MDGRFGSRSAKVVPVTSTPHILQVEGCRWFHDTLVDADL